MRLNEFLFKIFIDFIPDITDIYINDICICIEVNIPHIDGEISPGNHAVFIFGEGIRAAGIPWQLI